MTLRQRSVSGHLLLVLLLLVPQPLVPAVIAVDGTICNLIAAVDAANTDAAKGSCPAGSGADIIELQADATLTLENNTEDGPNGLPSVTTKITVHGNGYTIERSSVPGTPDFRILHVSQSGELTLEDVEVRNGRAPSGGGILNRGRLVLLNTTVNSNGAAAAVDTDSRGGGIDNLAYARLSNSTINDNYAASRLDTYGFRHASADGGGVYSGPDGVLTIENSTIRDNSAFGGVYGYRENAFGGGVRARGQLTISYSTISGNIVYAQDAAGGGIHAGTATISSSTISGNGGVVPGSSLGGGIHATSHVTLSNSTVSGNVAEHGGGLSGKGTVSHSTFHGNYADDSSSIEGLAPEGVTISGSVFADARGLTGAQHCLGALTDGGGGNLADDATCLPSFGLLDGLDGALEDNGGPTLTHRLTPMSTAIDPLPGGCGLGTDQRGAGRMGSCDSGAFEYLGDGCDLREFESQTIPGSALVLACHTALFGPDFVVDGPLADVDIYAGYLVTLRNGVEVRDDAGLTIGIDPTLLPP